MTPLPARFRKGTCMRSMKPVNAVLFCLTVAVAVVVAVLRFGLGFAGLYSPAWIMVAAVVGIITIKLLVSMIAALRHGKLGVDILAITAMVTTLFVNDEFGTTTVEGYWASLMVMLMITGGEALEDYATGKATKELRALLDNTPLLAHAVRDGKPIDVPAEKVRIGDTFLVKPGELVPVDGTLVKDSALFDESSLTGESAPVLHRKGETVLSGSVNEDTAVLLTAVKTAADSQYQTLVELVRQSAQKPAKFVRMADRYAVPFTIVSYAIAGSAWLFSWLLNTDQSIATGFARMATVLVVASPCPLILAAPIALISGMSRAASNGLIVKNADALEKLSRAKTIVFDKTGTLTSGVLTVARVVPQQWLSAADLIVYAASAEQNSSHILARSLLASLKGKILFKAEKTTEIPGNGLIAAINGREVRIGKASFIKGKEDEDSGKLTTTYVAINGRYAGAITFHDTVRPETARTIQDLARLGIKDFVLLTGDGEKIAQRVAREVGITKIKANCLPQDKIAFIKTVPVSERPVVMVGDGVNDAPALAAAEVGIALGARGSTAAGQSADIVILPDDLSKVYKAVLISKKTLVIARQAVLIGILASLALEIVAATGVIPALIGAVLQEGVDLVAIAWALRAHANK